MDLDDIKQLVTDASSATDASREEASEMLVFGRISQWDDEYGAACQTAYRGQFDLIKPKRNRILAELQANPVSVNFKPRDGADPEAANILQGMFRADMHDGEEATETALMDQLDCGYGAFRFVTEYESKFDDLNNYQRIKCEPIAEANNVVYWDSNSKKKDKSDARWCMILTPYTKEGWKRYCDENGINYEDNKDATSFKSPNTTDTFFWGKNQKQINIGEFYLKERKRKRVLIFENPLGDRVAYYETEIKSVIDELIDADFEKIGQKYKERWEVTKYLVSGEQIIKKQRIAGEHIPVVPVYGDWSIVEQREIWRGIYHDAQDAQRLHNFQMSYLADIVSQGPREKPIFDPRQIKGYEWMYSQNGADNNFPFLYQNLTDDKGQPLPAGPAAYLQNPTLPQGSAALLEYTRQSVDDVTGSGSDMPGMLNSQVTEGQIQAAQSAQNMETYLYQNSYQLAMKQAGRIYASMAAELYDVPREVTIRNEDGSEKTVMVKEAVFDYDTGEEVVLNDITRGAFEVVVSTGPSYTTQRDQVRNEMRMLFSELSGTPTGEMFLYHYLMNLEGPNTESIRKFAKQQLMMMGQVETETEEEMMMLQQMQEQAAMAAQQPDPNMLLAQAEMEKAKADQMGEQNKQAEIQIKAFDSETKRAKVMAENQMTAAEIQKTMTEINGNELDNVQKLAEQLMPRTLQ